MFKNKTDQFFLSTNEHYMAKTIRLSATKKYSPKALALKFGNKSCITVNR